MKKQSKGSTKQQPFSGLLRDDNETIDVPGSVTGSAMTGGEGMDAPNPGVDLGDREQPEHRKPPVHREPSGGHDPEWDSHPSYDRIPGE